MNELKIVTLMEDNLQGSGLTAEHGLSVYIETKKHKILVDTGKSEKTWENARVKGIDISEVETLFLSHGHYDHSGGLMKFAELNPSADIYMRDNAGDEYYSLHNGKARYIGIDKAALALSNLHLIKENTAIDEELSVFTNVHPTRKLPKGNKILKELKNGKYVQDTFSHEMYLTIRCSEGKYALISGCAHNGILNILDAFREIYGTDPFVVISGFHMIQTEYTADDLQEIQAAAEELSKMDTQFYSGHCTGEVPYNILKETLGDKLKAISDL